ncbi:MULTISPECIES: ABC transporter substrate-binding protein [unclassified Microbacterium]|uniref:ABC transporter substrate-binding protein n=1 Tax=unclassified Microbacterium TaxID=2609290 RepID=UPI00214C6E66|nr:MULTISPECIES: ABC transporter substrate-binding protein [unclassified Microbacterium]MCR2784614.1 ABC transporter substrate-binding protein [Microbacterium sp. zg.B96]WIM16157.1 ABC transporter substrate-binding protein [Microbacterium sp. zg-B96]
MRRKAALLRVAIPLTIAGLLLSGCAGGADPEPAGNSGAPSGPSGTLKVNWGGFPQSWAPGQSIEPGYLRVPYETLTTLGADGFTVEPWLATEWEQTPTDLTLTLRDDVTFHDGTPFNAEAVKINIEYVRDNGGQFSGALSGVDSIDVIDETHLKINFSRPAPTFLTMLTQRNVPIASPAAIADGSVVTAPVGTSPWAYDESASVQGTKMAFALTDDYWGEEPGFAGVELFGIADDTAATAALLSGEIDITDTEDDQLPTLESAENAELITYPAIRNNIVFFDRGPGGVFEDVDLRKALCYAADATGYKEIDSAVLDAPQQHFIDGEFGNNPDIVGYPDSSEAAAAFKAAGSPAVSATFPAAPFNKQQLEYFVDGMNQLAGVEVTVQELAVPQFLSDWNSGKYPLGVGNNPQIAPYDWYATWFAERAFSNPSGTESAQLKAAAQAAVAAGTTEEAQGLWAEVMRIIIDEEALACGFTVQSEIIAWNADTVSGVEQPTEAWEQNLVNYRDLKPVG